MHGNLRAIEKYQNCENVIFIENCFVWKRIIKSLEGSMLLGIW
jgi:hypothetical protein